MDFFEAQARAKKRTGRLVALFGFAVIGTIFAGYMVAVLILTRGNVGAAIWQPEVFAAVTVGTVAVVGIGALVKWAQYRGGGASVAESVGARRVDPATTDLAERRLLNVVEEMSIASGIPVPTVYLMADEAGINAFAAGLTTNDAVVTVTRGTLEKLNRDELQGVIGHEFSHILNGDMRLNMKIGALVFGILVIGLTGRGLLWGMRGARFRGSGRGKGGGQAFVVILAIGLGLLIVGYTGYFFGRLIQAAVSRQREFLADASAVQFTRNPGGIVNALRKIGGYALGSSMTTGKSDAIGHFFFAQGFRSYFGGMWATHPPLDERIRAIDPNFDGKYFEPKEVIDVETAPWSRVGEPADPAAHAAKVFGAAAFAGGAPARIKPFPPKLSLRKPQAIVSSAGTVTTEQLRQAESLLDTIPNSLREAARHPDGAIALTCGLLLARHPSLRSRQVALVEQHSGGAVAQALRALEPDLQRIEPAAKLPLLQLALPTLRTVPADRLAPYFATLDELVHADRSVSPFEFALQRLLLRSLSVGRRPEAAVIQVYSFHAVAEDISVVLSVLARAGAKSNEDIAATAFQSGAAEIKMLSGKLSLRAPESSGFAQLEVALEKLATASPAIKQRMLLAAAQTVSADGVVQVEEAELLRAIAATLDVPIPA